MNQSIPVNPTQTQMSQSIPGNPTQTQMNQSIPGNPMQAQGTPRPAVPQHPLRAAVRMALQRGSLGARARARAERLYWFLRYSAHRGAVGPGRVPGAFLGSLDRVAGAAARRGRTGLSRATIGRAMPDLRAVGAVFLVESHRRRGAGWGTLPSAYYVARTREEMRHFRHLYRLAARYSPRGAISAVARAKAFGAAFLAGVLAFGRWAVTIMPPAWRPRRRARRGLSGDASALLSAAARIFPDNPEIWPRWAEDQVSQRGRPWAGFAARCRWP